MTNNTTQDPGTPDKNSLLLIRLILMFQTAAMQQVSSSVQSVNGLAEKTVNVLLENFKVSKEDKSSQKSSSKPQNFDRRGNSRKY